MKMKKKKMKNIILMKLKIIMKIIMQIKKKKKLWIQMPNQKI